MKIELCNFSGFKIYPGHGKLYVRGDSKSFRFINGKNEAYFLQRLKPAKLDWTIVFRKLAKKGQTEETMKKKTRRVVKTQRAVAGASLDIILGKKQDAYKTEQRRKVQVANDKIKAEKDAKRKAEKAKKVMASGVQAPKQKVSKTQAKGGATAKVSAKSR